MMTEVKMGLRKHVWMIAVQAPIVIVGVGALVAVAIDLIEVTTGLTVFVAALVISVAASAWYIRTRRCPQCGQRLLPPGGWWYRFPGIPLLMRCVRCDIDWDFGLRGQQD
jgi:hypothetical protein